MTPVDRVRSNIEQTRAAKEQRDTSEIPVTSEPTVDAVVICAMGEELAPFMDAAEDPVSVEAPAGMKALTTTHGGQRMALIRSGIGMVCAAMATTWALQKFHPRAVVAAGTCGGMGSDVAVGDVIVSTQLTYGQADAIAFGYEPGQVPGQPTQFDADETLVAAARTASSDLDGSLRSGLVVTGDAFVTAHNIDNYRRQFPSALSADMESTAIAQVAHMHKYPVISVRAVSDLCGPEAQDDFRLGSEAASALSAGVVYRMLAA